MTWETNRGCPFSCTFCDWGSATASKVYQFGMDGLHDEIGWMSRQRIGFVFCCDANFGRAMLETCGWVWEGVPSLVIRIKGSSKARACQRGSGRYACAHRSHLRGVDASGRDGRRVVDR